MQVPEGYTLITSIGTNTMHLTTYVLSGGPREPAPRGYFSAAALPALIGKPARALVLLTQKAREHQNWADFQKEFLTNAKFIPQDVPIPDGQSDDEIFQIFKTLSALCVENERVVLDVTNAFRSLPFVYFASLNYLQALRGTVVERICYGAFEAGKELTTIIDLAWLLRLTDWSYAVRAFNDGGSLRPVRSLLVAGLAGSASQQLSGVLKGIVRAVDAVEPAIAGGLPLETGIAARDLVSHLGEASAEKLEPLGLGAYVLPYLRDKVEPFATKSGARAKGDLPLDLGELQRELSLIRQYVRSRNYHTGVLLLREWVVSRMLLNASDIQGLWIEHGDRKPRDLMEDRINARKAATPKRQWSWLLAYWNWLTDTRNFYAHAGFRRAEAEKDIDSRLNDYLNATEKHLNDDGFWSLV